jgi:hypothetical protein
MTIHSLYIFNRSGGCLYYGEWNRPKYSLASTPDEDRKLSESGIVLVESCFYASRYFPHPPVFGFCFEMCTTMNKMSPVM